MSNKSIFQVLCLLAAVLSGSAMGRSLPTGATVVQLFEWRWDDIARECSRLAASGIRFVHVSPPNEHVPLPGSPWYDRYQPVSYQIGNRSGDEAAFAYMLRTCRTAGVGILVDAVINHMAIIPPEGVQRFGNLGSSYWRYSFPGLYSHWDFHRCDRNPPDSHIGNYNDRYEVQNCNLSGLADLATGTDYVRETLGEYLRTLVDLGVAGFRIDAAKHIPASDITAILSRMNRPDAYIFQEVIDSPSEPIQAEEYVWNGQVSEFGYAAAVGWRFRDGRLDGLLADLSRLELRTHEAIVFIDNHDTQRGHGAGQSALNYKNGTRYALANAFMLAWPYGTPILMSSFRFQSDLQGPPMGAAGLNRPIDTTCGADDSVPWVCEHRWPLIKTMARWRSLVGSGLVSEVTEGPSALAFSRGRTGFFALSLGSTDVIRDYKTTLPAGTYCDMLAWDGSAEDCPTSVQVVVNELGMARIKVPANWAVALHVTHRPGSRHH